jgi:hypothetical protein
MLGGGAGDDSRRCHVRWQRENDREHESPQLESWCPRASLSRSPTGPLVGRASSRGGSYAFAV